MSASAIRRARRLRAAKPPQHDRGADGPAMLARACRPVETAVAGVLATQTLDGHLLDRMHQRAQLSDRQYEAAMRLLEMCDAAGLSIAGAAQYGRITFDRGPPSEMPDEMAEARGAWNRLMRGVGGHKADLLFSLCHERHPGVAWLATAQSALCQLANQWKLGRCEECAAMGRTRCGG